MFFTSYCWPAPTNPQSLVCPAPKSCSSMVSWPWNHLITLCFPPIHIAEQLFTHFFISCFYEFPYLSTNHALISVFYYPVLNSCLYIIVQTSFKITPVFQFNFPSRKFFSTEKSLQSFFSNRVLYFCVWYKYCS